MSTKKNDKPKSKATKTATKKSSKKKTTKRVSESTAGSELDRKGLKKAYLTNNVETFINSQMAKGFEINTDEVVEYLRVVEAERSAKVLALGKYITPDDSSPSAIPSGKELTDEDKIAIFSNAKKAEEALNHYKAIANRAHEATVQSDLQNIGHTLASLSLDVKRFRYLMYQKYMRKLFTEWSENFRLTSRKEAEDFATTTAEYYDFKSAYALEQACEDAMINCRKEFSKM